MAFLWTQVMAALLRREGRRWTQEQVGGKEDCTGIVIDTVVALYIIIRETSQELAAHGLCLVFFKHCCHRAFDSRHAVVSPSYLPSPQASLRYPHSGTQPPWPNPKAKASDAVSTPVFHPLALPTTPLCRRNPVPRVDRSRPLARMMGGLVIRAMVGLLGSSAFHWVGLVALARGRR